MSVFPISRSRVKPYQFLIPLLSQNKIMFITLETSATRCKSSQIFTIFPPKESLMSHSSHELFIFSKALSLLLLLPSLLPSSLSLSFSLFPSLSHLQPLFLLSTTQSKAMPNLSYIYIISPPSLLPFSYMYLLLYFPSMTHSALECSRIIVPTS